jgi:polyhydroxyalkanoate synthesis regulator phasin
MISEMVKKSLAFGLGVAALTTDKLKQFVDEAVARGEMSGDEAKKFMDDVQNRAEDEKKNMQGWIRDQVNKIVMAGGAADADRVAQIDGRLDAIERRLDAIAARLPEEPLKPGDETPTVTTE